MGLDPEQLHNLTTALGISEANKRSREEQARLAALQSEVAALRQAQESHSKKPQCPVCGGRLDGEFRKCMHCTADLIWLDGVPGEPGQEEQLRATVEDKKRAAEQERIDAEIRRREAAHAATQPRPIRCSKCNATFTFYPEKPSTICPDCVGVWWFLFFGTLFIFIGFLAVVGFVSCTTH